jgi:Family of unknown function (DUF5681)
MPKRKMNMRSAAAFRPRKPGPCTARLPASGCAMSVVLAPCSQRNLRAQTEESEMKKKLSKRQIETLRRNQFKPGESGNPGGLGSAKRLLTTALRELLERPYPGDAEGRTYAEMVAFSVVERAIVGDVAAAKLVGERTEGLPQMAVKIGPGLDMGDYHVVFHGEMRRIGDLTNSELDELNDECKKVLAEPVQ